MFDGILLHFLMREVKKEKEWIKDFLKDGWNFSLVLSRTSLIFNLHPRYAHMKIGKGKGQGFFTTLLRGRKIKKLEQVDMDRVVVVETGDGKKIEFIPAGKGANLIIRDGGEVVFSLREVRELPPVEGVSPFSPEAPFSSSVLGFGRRSMKHLLSLPPEERERFFRDLREGKLSPCVYIKDEKPYLILPVEVELGMEKRRFSSLNDAVSWAFEELERREERERKIKEALKKIERRIENLRYSLLQVEREGENPEVLQRKGELILMNQHRIKKGMEKIVLEDWEGRQYEIELDPSLSPVDNAQNYFKKAKKERKKRERKEELRKRMEEELKKLEEEKERILKGEVRERVREEERVEKFKCYITSGGYRVYVGRNAQENEELTFGFARPWDLFFHVREAPGSHTIMRIPEKGKMPPMKDIEEAAAIAAYHSKMRTSSVVPVSYTERRYVHGIKGKKGLVRIEREKVVFVRPFKTSKNP